MARLLQWRYTLPRLALLIALLLVGQWTLGRAARRSVIRSCQQSLGARVEVDGAQLSLWNHQLSLRDVRLASPFSSLHNLVEANHCDFSWETSALLHKRTVVDHGTISGLRFGTERRSSGLLPGEDQASLLPADGWVDEQSARQARQWLDRLQLQFNRDLVNELASIQLTERLVTRWPTKSDDLGKSLVGLRERITNLQQKVRAAKSNPLRHAEFLEKLPNRIDRIRDDVAELTDKLQKLPDVLETDRREIVAARRHDEQLLRDELAFEKIDADVLTAYLLQSQLSGPVAELVGWARWVRHVVPADPNGALTHQPATANRGKQIVFPGCRQVPGLVIRSVDLQGTTRVGGQSFELIGRVTDVSSDPSLHDQPIQLRLKSRGSLPLELRATIDRTGPVPRDQLLVNCGTVLVPKLQLGDSDSLRLTVKPATASLTVSITLDGDRLSGDIQLVERQAEITTSVNEELDRFKLAHALKESLGRSPSIAMRVSLSGTVDEPQWKVWSNLGPAVAEALDRAVDRAANEHAGRLLATARKRADQKLAQIDREVAEQVARLGPQLSASNSALRSLANRANPSGRLSVENIGRRLPDDSQFH